MMITARMIRSQSCKSLFGRDRLDACLVWIEFLGGLITAASYSFGKGQQPSNSNFMARDRTEMYTSGGGLLSRRIPKLHVLDKHGAGGHQSTSTHRSLSRTDS